MIYFLLLIALVPLLGLIVSLRSSAFLGISVGILAGVSFHLLVSSQFILLFPVGFIFFYLCEKFLWRHCHEEGCKIHPVSYLTLLGDAIHSFVNGVIIASAFQLSFASGVLAFLAVFLHAVPHQMGNLSILIAGGMKKTRAVMLNTLSSLPVLAGAVLLIDPRLVVPFGAGGFAYISSSDFLLRKIKKHHVLLGFAITFLPSLIFPL
ncbi:MAG: ZIP family metal transporter [Candidatus Micrarchaeota archaeon]|nr:ZIP family metal transporter [Candidatus Micrarchaeota archaeon]